MCIRDRSDSERYDFEDAVTWAEANLAHVVHGNYEVETVPVAASEVRTDNYPDFVHTTVPETSSESSIRGTFSSIFNLTRPRNPIGIFESILGNLDQDRDDRNRN